MGKNNLVPVVRPDINGKLVTRHVLPESDAKTPVTIPAPKVSKPLGPASREDFSTAIASAVAPYYEGRDNSTPETLQFTSAMLSSDYEEMSMATLMAFHRRLETWTEAEKNVLANGMQNFTNTVIDQFLDEDKAERAYFGVLETLDLCAAFKAPDYPPHTLLNNCYIALVTTAEFLGVDSRDWLPKYDRDKLRLFVFRELANEHGRTANHEIEEDVAWFVRNEKAILENTHLLAAHTNNGVVDREWVDALAASPARGLNEGIL